MRKIPKTLVPCVVAALVVLASTPHRAFAQNPFVIDGVVPANGTVSGPDETADPFGSVRELGPVNSNTTKVGVIHSATPPMLSFTNPNGQVDLRRIWTQTVHAPDNDIWFYFAWERDANSGSGFIAYEFQQSALSPSCAYTAAGIDMILPESGAETALINSCNPWQNRQAGDFLIMWDQTGSGLTITKRVFTLSGGVLVLGPNEPLGSAVVAISADGFRGEAAVNLTTDVFPPNQCVSFANIIPGTVTGNSDTADYKDTVLAPFEPIANCGLVTVTKHIIPTDATGSFPYTLARADGSPVRFDGTTQISNTLTFHGDSTGSPILNLLAGNNYTLVEAPQSMPWELVSIVCTFDDEPPVDLTNGGTFKVDPSSPTHCVITNRRLRGMLQVIKNVINDNGGTAVPGDFTITLGDSANTTFPGASGNGTVFTFDHGYAFDVEEIGIPAGYTLVSMTGSCTGTIVANTTQTCVITNDDNKANPAGVTVQRAILHDTLNVTGIRTGSPGAAATVTFRLYADAACSALVGAEGPVSLALSGSTGTATTVNGILVMQSATTVYYWTAEYTGDQFNNAFTTACGSEKTTIVFQQ